MATFGFDTDPANNVLLNGIDVSENCPSGNINNAIRQLMADLEVFAQALPDTVDLMPKDGGEFEGTQPIYTGRGAVLHNDDSGATSGRVFRQQQGTPDPAMVNGDTLLEYL